MSEQEAILVEKRLRIETLSALHIGTGEQLGAKNYARQGQQLFVAKPEKVLALVRLSPQVESAFLAFCEDGQQTLTDFLQQQRVSFGDITAYRVRATGQVGRLIPVFIKTPEGKSYIPGSSLKGAVRSALFRGGVISDNAIRNAAAKAARDDLNQISRQRNPSLSRWRKKIGTDVERTFFGKDEHHDLMRCLQFGDSTALEPTELCIAEVRVLSIGASSDLRPARDPHRSDREMRPVTPEVLPKGVEVICPFTFNLYLLSSTSPVNRLGFCQKAEFIKAWLAGCNRAAQDLIEQEIEFFTRHRFEGKQQIAQWYETLGKQLQQIQRAGNQCLLHIAWGSGWDAKTITDQFDDNLFDDVRRTLRLNVGQPRGSNTLLPKKDSPKSRKVVFENGQPQEPIGWVKVTLEEGLD